MASQFGVISTASCAGLIQSITSSSEFSPIIVENTCGAPLRVYKNDVRVNVKVVAIYGDGASLPSIGDTFTTSQGSFICTKTSLEEKNTDFAIMTVEGTYYVDEGISACYTS